MLNVPIDLPSCTNVSYTIKNWYILNEFVFFLFWFCIVRNFRTHWGLIEDDTTALRTVVRQKPYVLHEMILKSGVATWWDRDVVFVKYLCQLFWCLEDNVIVCRSHAVTFFSGKYVWKRGRLEHHYWLDKPQRLIRSD